MNTKDIVLVVAGVAVGYLLVGFMNKSKDNAQGTMYSVEPMVDKAKVDKCNEEVALLMQTAKFGTPEAREAFKKEAFEACMAKKTLV